MRLDHFPHVLKRLFEDRDDLWAKSRWEVTIEIHGSPPLRALLSAVARVGLRSPPTHSANSSWLRLFKIAHSDNRKTHRHWGKGTEPAPTCCLKERTDCARLTIV